MKKSIVALAVTSAALSSVSAYANKELDRLAHELETSAWRKGIYNEHTSVYDGEEQVPVSTKEDAEKATLSYKGSIKYALTGTNGPEGGMTDIGSFIELRGQSPVCDTMTAFAHAKLSAQYMDLTQLRDWTGYHGTGLEVANAQLGLKGNFGKVQMGSWKGVYNNAVQGGVDNSEYGYFAATHHSPEGDTVAYTSPSIDGFELQASIQYSGYFETATFSSVNNDANNLFSGAASVKYSTDMFSVGIGYDENRFGWEKPGKSAAGVKVTVNPTTDLALAAKYEQQENDVMAALSATYDYDMGSSVYAGYSRQKDKGIGKSKDSSYIGVNYRVTDSVQVYAETGQTQKDQRIRTTLGTSYFF